LGAAEFSGDLARSICGGASRYVSAGPVGARRCGGGRPRSVLGGPVLMGGWGPEGDNPTPPVGVPRGRPWARRRKVFGGAFRSHSAKGPTAAGGHITTVYSPCLGAATNEGPRWKSPPAQALSSFAKKIRSPVRETARGIFQGPVEAVVPSAPGSSMCPSFSIDCRGAFRLSRGGCAPARVSDGLG